MADKHGKLTAGLVEEAVKGIESGQDSGFDLS
jgi:hypothetical protein